MGGSFRPTVFLDANVIDSKTVRDWIGLIYTSRVSEFPLFDVRISEDVLAEALASIRDLHPEMSGQQIARVREIMLEHFENALVTDYDVATSGYRGPDPGDAHVHAAAVACGADYLVTANHQDFIPLDGDDDRTADDLPYELFTPDDFLLHLTQAAPAALDEAIQRQIEYYQASQQDIDLCEPLRRAGCPDFARTVLTALQTQALQR